MLFEQTNFPVDRFHVDEESNKGDRPTEDISKYVTMKHATYEGLEPETETEIQEEEGKGRCQKHPEGGGVLRFVAKGRKTLTPPPP